MSKMAEKEHRDDGQKNTVVVGADVENPPARYQPTRWQSNITIASCVSPCSLNMQQEY